MATDILASDFDSRLRLKTKTIGGERIKRAKETGEDIAVLSMFLPGATAAKENATFRCHLGMECMLGDCRDTTPGLLFWNSGLEVFGSLAKMRGCLCLKKVKPEFK